MTARSALFWIAAACCVVAEIAILRSLLFGRALAERTAAAPSMSLAPGDQPPGGRLRGPCCRPLVFSSFSI